MILPGGPLSEASLEASRPLDRRALGRGIEMRSVYQDSARNDPATLAYARWLTEEGGQVRTSPLLPPRLLIFDAKVAVVPIDPANSRLGVLCTRAPGIVASLLTLFEQTWDSAVPLGADRPRPTDSKPTAGELELLKLLASGMTDEAAGKRLGVSLRTIRVRADGTPPRQQPLRGRPEGGPAGLALSGPTDRTANGGAGSLPDSPGGRGRWLSVLKVVDDMVRQWASPNLAGG
ncbi:hypothetical protein ACIGQE_20955 [Streptomyces sp. NPDC053429]|uniref:hypothetical protein n=1 Tax=Streptomyces sp. NPDC053429 TaxID=3365702 RepID=UPI0037D096DC